MTNNTKPDNVVSEPEQRPGGKVHDRRRFISNSAIAAGAAGIGIAAGVVNAPAAQALGGTSPTGPAGGSLTGTYPNPGIGAAAIGDAHIDSTDPIGRDKLAPPEARRIVGGAGEPAFGAGWSNSGSGGRELSFWYDDGTDLVHIEGVVKSTGAGVLLFVLPSGYRPSQNINGMTKELFTSNILDWGVAASGDVSLGPAGTYNPVGLSISFRLGS